MTETAAARVRDLNLYRRYFDLVAAGEKTIEVRVKYPHLEDVASGDVIRFRIKDTDETCAVHVKRATEYKTFEELEELLDGEGPSNVNPVSSREQQLANIREIYPAQKEALGVLAIEIELLPQ
jgi:ASC-1-like (ASCH) protein